MYRNTFDWQRDVKSCTFCHKHDFHLQKQEKSHIYIDSPSDTDVPPPADAQTQGKREKIDCFAQEKESTPLRRGADCGKVRQGTGRTI